MNTKIRVGGAVLVGVSLVAIALFFDSKKSVALEGSAAVVIVATTPKNIQKNQDTDGDGIPDWEEKLLGTDPSQKNEYPKTPPPDIAEKEEPIPDTATTRFMQSVMGPYITKTLNGTPLDEAGKQKLIDDAIAGASRYTVDKLFTAKDLFVSASETDASIKTYGNLLGSALNKNPGTNENEMFILKRALDSENEEELALLDPKIHAYRKTLDEMRAIPVPPSLKEEHLSLLNKILTVHNTIVTMRRAFEDPLPALMRSQEYFTHVEHLSQALSQITARLKDKNISYTKDENGFLLFIFAP